MIAPVYGKPFLRRHNNDAAGAEAILEAAQRPGMRFRVRDRLVRHWMELLTALRAHLYAFGHAVPIGRAGLKKMAAIRNDPASDLPALVRDQGRDLLAQIAEKSGRIDGASARIGSMAEQTDTARQLQSMPGLSDHGACHQGVCSADGELSPGPRFAAWLGLVARQYSSGGKQRLGRVSKAGSADIRGLPIIGTMSRLNRRRQHAIAKGAWLARMMERKPRMLVAIALANKMARAIWAMLTKGEDKHGRMIDQIGIGRASRKLRAS